MSELPKIMVAICTYKRNEPLRTLLNALIKVAEATADRAEIGVAISDDNPDQRAKVVAEEFANSFALGVRYGSSGKANISLARNLAVETALEGADWVAMIDDDCEPEPTWLCEYLDVLEKTGADCATGPENLRVPPGSPAWLVDEPFFDDVRFDFEDCAPMVTAATHNSIIRAEFLRARPELRFDPALGKISGEDVVFYRTAYMAGLKIRFAKHAAVWGNEPADRATFKFVVEYRYWLGNSMFVTNRYFGESRTRLFLRGSKMLVKGLLRPVGRVLRAQSPQWRYGVASAVKGVGMLSGVFGYRKIHK